MSRASVVLAMPLRCDVISQIAANHLHSGILESSKIAPTRIENRNLATQDRLGQARI